MSIDVESIRAAILAGTQIGPNARIVPDNMSVVHLESFLDAPKRHRGTMHCGDAGVFEKYIRDNAVVGTDPALFVDPDKIAAVCIFDIGSIRDPAWGDHMATYSATKALVYEGLSDLCFKVSKQDDLLEFIEDFGSGFSFWRRIGEDVQLLTRSVAYSRFANLTVEGVRRITAKREDLGHERTVMESVSVSTEIPTHFSFTGVCYSGLPEQERTFRVTAVDVGGVVGFKVREVAKQIADDEARRQFILRMATGDDQGEGGAIQNGRIYTGEWTNRQPTGI